jgi:hypothetical protein
MSTRLFAGFFATEGPQSDFRPSVAVCDMLLFDSPVLSTSAWHAGIRALFRRAEGARPSVAG